MSEGQSSCRFLRLNPPTAELGRPDIRPAVSLFQSISLESFIV